jgi:hypothetical protein
MKKLIIILTTTLFLISFFGVSQNLEAIEKTLYLYDDISSYPWSGFMGSSNGQSLNLDHRFTNNPASGVYCSKIFAEGWESWAGIYIQNKDSNWNGPGADFTGCTQIVFSYRGAPVGETVEIKAFNDQISGQSVTLSNDWQTKEISLIEVPNVTNVWNILAFIFQGQGEKTIYIDDVYIAFDRPVQTPASVTIAGQGPPTWDYTIRVDNVDYFVRGVGYNASWPSTRNDEDFALMVDSQVNTINLWGQIDLTPALLDNAADAGLMVAVNYWLPRGDENPGDPNYDAPYTDPVFRAAVKNSVFNFVAFYQDHSAVLMWSLGNEVFYNLEPGTEQNKLALANLIDELAAELHTQDPNHPVTYASVTDEAVPYLCDTSLDIFGSNAYAVVESMLDSYRAGDCDKPIILLEYGCDGWWERPWSDYSDLERAKDYGDRAMKIYEERGMTLGGCAFAWIDKTEGKQQTTRGCDLQSSDTGFSPYTGWGLVNNDLTPRFQLRAINAVYQSEVTEDAIVRIHLNAPHYSPGDSIKIWSFMANPNATVRSVDFINAIAWRNGYFFFPSWLYMATGWDAVNLNIPFYYFQIVQTLGSLWPAKASFPGSSTAYGVFVESETLHWIGGPSVAIHAIPFTFGDSLDLKIRDTLN